MSTLLATVLLALAVSPTPVTQIREPNLSLPFTLRLNVSGSTLPELDRARAANLKSKAGKLDRRQSSFDVTNVAVVYSADVGVGTPPTTYSLLIDTGSSNTWVGAGKSFVRTSSSVSTGRRVSVTYGSGSFSGTECKSSPSIK